MKPRRRGEAALLGGEILPDGRTRTRRKAEPLKLEQELRQWKYAEEVKEKAAASRQQRQRQAKQALAGLHKVEFEVRHKWKQGFQR